MDPSGQAPLQMSKRYKALETLNAEQRRKLAASSTGAAVLRQSANQTVLQPHAAQSSARNREEEQSRSINLVGNADLSHGSAGALARGKSAKNPKAQRPVSNLQSLSGLQSMQRLDAHQDFAGVDAALPLPGLSLQTDYDPGSKLGFISAKELDFNPVSMRALRAKDKHQSESKGETASRRQAGAAEEPRETRRHKLNELSPGKRRLQELSDPDPAKRMKDEVLHPH